MQNKNSNEEVVTVEENVSTKHPTDTKEKQQTKRRKNASWEDGDSQLLHKAIDCLEKGRADNKDADGLFGQYVTSELKQIADPSKKRFIKFKIQTLFYELLCSPRAPDYVYPFGMSGDWDSSRGSTPSPWSPP